MRGGHGRQIAFRIEEATATPWKTIHVLSPLPRIVQYVDIDGTSQTLDVGNTNTGGPEIEISFAGRSWGGTDPLDRSTSDIVRGGCRILVDKESLFEHLKTAARVDG